MKPAILFKLVLVLLSGLTQAAGQRECSDGEVRLNDNCSISVCKEGAFVVYKGYSPPDIEFSKLFEKNCIHVDTKYMDFSDARENCQRLGGDLYAAGDYQGMSRYLQTLAPAPWLWVGVKGRTWLSGRPVATKEWNLNEPNDGVDFCGFVEPGRPGLSDGGCSFISHSMCQLGVTYPSECKNGDVQISTICSIDTCRGGYWLPNDDAIAPDIPITLLHEAGCIILEKELLNFKDARDRCLSKGGDLFVPGDFYGLVKLLQQQMDYFTWVGVKDRVWLTGRRVINEEWAKGEPNGPRTSCGIIPKLRPGVDDVDCGSKAYSICHIRKRYPIGRC